jgi:hypothetical protein
VSKRSYLALPRQRKVCMVKATLLELQSSRSKGRRQRMVAETPQWGIVMDITSPRLEKFRALSMHVLNPASPSCPPSAGLKGRTGHLNTPHLGHTANAGSPKQVMREKHTCMATEPPYYSRWTRNGVCRRLTKPYRHGHKGMATYPENPAVWEEGRQSLPPTTTQKARAC